MAFVSGDRVKETSTTTGTGNLTLAGAVANFQAFSIFANDDTFFYAVVHQTVSEWEVGIGTYVSATPALARTTVLESSNADAAVSFSAGTKDVFVTHPSSMALQMEQMAAPAAAATNWITQYAAESGTPQVRTADEFGLKDVLSCRDRYRFRREYYFGVGSDLASGTVADALNYGFPLTTLEGVFVNATFDVDGVRKSIPTAAVLDADAGIFSGAMMRRDFNPDFTVRFRVVSSAVRRVWIGWMEADHMATDSTAATHKFALRLSTAPAVTGYTIVHSDGTTEVVEAQIQASDTLIHTIRLVADNANARFGYSFDGAAIVWITTNIPAATDNLIFQCQIRTLEAVAKTLELAWIMGSADK